MQIAHTEFTYPLSLVTPAHRNLLDRDAPTARMYLTARPISPVAKAFVGTLAANLIVLSGARKTPSPEYIIALGAMIAELMRAADYNPPRACFRPLKAASFTDCSVGHRPFDRALKDMFRDGFVKMEKGVSAWGTRQGTVTRIHLTPKLTHQLASNGITVAERFRHFSYQRAMEDVPPVQLRAATTKQWPRIFRGAKMKVDYSIPAVAEHAKQMRCINDYLSKQTIIDHEGVKLDIALRRVFNLGDRPGHNYMKGGRAYDGYQNVKREERKRFTINGRTTVEVDISACFLTLLHHFLDRPFNAAADPYAGPNLPRDIIKAWVNFTIGHSGYHRSWPTEAIVKLGEKGYRDLSSQYPIKRVRDEILRHIPIVAEWVESEHTWADLFRMESQIMLDATQRLAEQYNVAALIMHDALKVTVGSADITRKVIKEEFLRHTGLMPIVAE